MYGIIYGMYCTSCVVRKAANMAVSRVTLQHCRCISTSVACCGKRNFRKFLLYNKRGTKLFREKQTTKDRDPDLFHDLGVKPVGYGIGDTFVKVPEMIPELIVPDLTDFKLKPYVSYRVPEVVQSEFTSRDLFDAVYSEKIVNDFKSGKLGETGEPLEPSPEEQLTPEAAYTQARKTGTDIF